MRSEDLLAQVEFLPDRPRTKLLHDTENLRLVLFCLKAGQEVAPHTSSSEVILLGLSGSGRFTTGNGETAFSAGSIGLCQPNQPHGFRAETDLVVLATIAPRP